MWTLLNESTPCTCSRAPVVESSETCSSDISLLAQSKSKRIPEKFCLQGSLTVAYLDSLFGMTCAPSAPTIQIAPNTSNGCAGSETGCVSVEGSRARTSVAPGKVQESTENDQACGVSSPVSLARYDPLTSSWKIPQCSLFGGQRESLQTWPAWGMWDETECWELDTPELHIYGKECGFWHPTPTKCDYKGANMRGEKQRESQLKEWLHVRYSQGAHTTYPHPTFLEQVMGWTIGWTELAPLETGKFRQWLDSHGNCYPTESERGVTNG